MIPEKQLQAILHLLDDPDEAVQQAVFARILEYGPRAIQQLEKAWANIEDEAQQERIETLIHRVHLTELSAAFRHWNEADDPELLQGAILLSRYAYPGLNTELVIAQFERIRRNLWLEVNQYLAPVEQINAFNAILYGYYRLQGQELSRNEPAHFFINTLLDSRVGNAYTLGVLYLALCERLDVPLFAISIPQQFLFAYLDGFVPGVSDEETDLIKHVRFFVDPVSGGIYTKADVANYLNRIKAPPSLNYLVPMSARAILRQMMTALAHTYDQQGKQDKADDIRQLRDLINRDEDVPEDDL
jgi:regulator of sirC expression with transglutaminase-like and TPR domain